MSLASGSKLLHYEVVAPIGAGAMGEVWRAKDTRLGREVAIKVLPEHFADDEERLRRFEREAKTLATLNHPNVAQIFGVDQVEDTCFLVLELVPGESLEERLKRGPLSLDETLDVCRQIAEGLEAAHEAGVIHRDLKPANIRLTPDGRVKVLDFGLAKPANESGSGSSTDSVLSTEAGRLLGTPTYMAPEQARGKQIDKRVDIWAFGCVLYECLTAKRAFAGETLTDVFAAVIEREPDWSKLPAATPPRLRELLQRCFAKDPRARLRDIGEARVLLQAPPEPASTSPAAARSAPALLPWALFALAAASSAFFALRSPAASDATAHKIGYRFTLPRAREGAGFPVLSPDGRWTVSVARDGLWLRALDERTAHKLEGTDRAAEPFWSPDSRQIGFFAEGKLKRVGTSGAPPVIVADCPAGWAIATWSVDGSILIDLTESTDEEGWYLVEPGAASARKIRGFPKNREIGPDKSYPCFLPDGRHFLFTQPFEGKPWLQLGSLDSPDVRRLAIAGSKARYVEPGYVLYVRDGVLLAHAFDARTFELEGDALEVERGVSFFAPTGSASFSVSQQGTLVLEPVSKGSTLKWVDRDGRELESVLRSEQRVRGMDLAPDGKRLVYSLVDSRDGTADLWLLDLERGVSSRLTSVPRGEYSPCWDPRGTRIVFSSDWKGPPNLQLLELTGAPPRELVPFDRHVQWAGSWTPDGTAVLYSAASGGNDSDLWLVDVASGERRVLLSTKFSESRPVLSPDGKRLAFVSDTSGRPEVYLAPFPPGTEFLRVSADGGTSPAWSADGKEILFESLDDALLSVALDTDAAGTLHAGRPKLLFHVADRTLNMWRLSKDGQRILVCVGNAEEASPADDVIVDWPNALKH